MKVSAIHDNWRDIICCGLENQQLDFKSHQNWNTIGHVGRAKFAKHAMALANTQGGYVVVGVSEDKNGNPTDFTGMTEEEASSFDPSTVGQTINTFAEPPVEMDVTRPVIDGKRYVVLVIYPFRDMPHVCAESCEHELQRGAFYVRTTDARSKAACKASELHQLIQRALRNQRQTLGRMLRGILYEDRINDSPDTTLISSLLERCRQQAANALGRTTLRYAPYFEVICHPVKLLQDVSVSELRRATLAIEQPSLDDLPWASTMTRTENFATNDSLRGVLQISGKPCFYWEIFTNGLFYLAELIPPHTDNEKAVNASALALSVYYALAILGHLYTNLKCDDALLDIAMRIPNSENAALQNMPQLAEPPQALCRILDVEVSRQRSAADLEGGAAIDTAVRFFAEICARFNHLLDKADEEAVRRFLENA